MVTTETLQVILNAKDMLTSKVKQANEAIKQTGTIANTSGTTASNATNRIGSAYERLRSKVTNVFNNIKQVIKNSSVGTAVNENGLARPFLNAAEKIKQKWTSMTETIKSKLKGLNTNANVDGGFNISAAGLATLNGQITTTTGKVSTLGNMIIRIGGYSSTLGIKLSTAFATAQTKVEAFRTKLQGVGQRMQSVVGGLSGVQSAILGAFGAVGVTSLSQFTIGAAAARQKLNAVTTAITGSEAATKSLNNAISKATSGGVMGFTKVAQAVQQIGIKYNLTNQQLEATAPVLNKIGTLARAMGKDSETAATMMSKAYDGLNGNFMLLKRNLGITKEQLLDAGWSGAASDVDGYTMALQKVLDTKPEMQEYLNSYEGQMERLRFAIQGVGRQIGEIFLPIINMVLGTFLELHKQCPMLTTVLVALAVGIVGLISVLSVLAPVIMMIIELHEMEAFATLAAYWPYLLIAAAILIVIGILLYFYNTNESVRNAMNKVGDTIKTVVSTAWEKLQKVIQPLITTFNHLMQVLGRLGKDLLAVFGITGNAADEFDWLGTIIEFLGNVFLVLVEHVVGLVEVFASILVPVIGFIVNVIANLIDFVITLGEAFSLLMSGDILGFFTVLGQAFATLLINVVINFGQMFLEIINNLNLMFNNVLLLLGAWITNMVTGFLLAGYNSVIGFINWISQLPSMFGMWLLDAWNKLVLWAGNIVNKFKEAASNAVTNFINWVKTLPGKFWNWLVETYSKITSFKSILVQKIKDAAKAMLDGFIEWVRKLPSKFGGWLGKIKDEIWNRRGALVSAIIKLGKDLLNNFKNALLNSITGGAYVASAVNNQVDMIVKSYQDSTKIVTASASKLGMEAIKAFEDTGANSLTGALQNNKKDISYKISSKLKDETKIRKDEELYLKEILNYLTSNTGPVIVDNTGNIKVDYNLTVDGLPDTIDEETVANIVIETIQSKDVIKQIVTSPTFQRFDERTKNKLLNELRRHI